MSIRPFSFSMVLRPRSSPMRDTSHTAITRNALWAWAIAVFVAVLVGFVTAKPLYVGLVIAASGCIVGANRILKQPVWGLGVMVTLLPFFPLLRYIGTYFNIPLPFGILGLWPEGVLGLLFLHVLVVRMKRGEHLRVTWDDAPLAIMAASALYGALLTIVERQYVAALYGCHATLFGFAVFWIVNWLGLSPAQVRRVLGIWLLSFAAFALLSLYDYIVRPAFFIELAILARPEFWGNWDPHVFFAWYPRMQSLMFAEQTWGTSCALVSLYCLAWFGEPKNRPRGLIWLFLLSTLCLALSMSRGGQAFWVFGVFGLFMFRGRHRWAIVATSILLGIAALCLVVYWGENGTAITLIDRTMALGDTSENSSAFNRVSQWRYALEMFPLFPAGRGLGRGGTAALLHGISDGMPAVVDGGYFTLLTEEGLPGILFFLIGALWYLGRARQREALLARLGDREGAVLMRSSVACLCGALVHTIGGSPLDSYYVAPVFWILTAVALSRRPQVALPVAPGQEAPQLPAAPLT